jgi:hypothetical protein
VLIFSQIIVASCTLGCVGVSLLLTLNISCLLEGLQRDVMTV